MARIGERPAAPTPEWADAAEVTRIGLADLPHAAA
jgi:hypothetical protein